MRGSLLVVVLSLASSLAACGKTNSLADAGGLGDGAGADAAVSIDADAHGVVTVKTFLQGSGSGFASGIAVVFVEPDGSIAAEVPSDGSGIASASVLPGASVTAVYPSSGSGSSTTIYTVLAVKPGDIIDMGPFEFQQSPLTDTFTANVSPNGGDGTYTVYGPCGDTRVTGVGSGSANPIALSLGSSCELPTMDLVALSANGSGTTDGYQEKSGVTYSNAGSAAMSGTWSPLETITATYDNVPGVLGDVGFLVHVPDSFGYEATRYSGVDGTTVTASVTAPVAQSSLYESSFQNGNDVAFQESFAQVAGTPATYEVDLSTALLPWLELPTLDAANGAIDTVVDGTGSGDVFFSEVVYRRTVNDSTVSYDWTVFGPTAGNQTLPPMPSDLSDVTPLAGDTPTYSYAELDDIDAITSYDQLRDHLFDGELYYFEGRAGGTGRVRDSYVEPNEGLTGHAPHAHTPVLRPR